MHDPVVSMVHFPRDIAQGNSLSGAKGRVKLQSTACTDIFPAFILKDEMKVEEESQTYRQDL